jgi:TetR/AcrR family fatty acid metabolism transcriptional regulator
MSPKIVDREQKRLQIIGSAFNVLQEKGYMDTKMSDIAEEAGMGKGTIYEYFDSRDELVAATFETMISMTQDNVLKTLDTIEDPEEKVRRFIRMRARLFTEISGIFRLFIGLVQNIDDKTDKLDSRSFLRDMYERAIEKIEDVLQDGIDRGIFRKVDKRSVAILMLCIMDGLQMPYDVDHNLVNVESINKVVEEMMIHYLT